MCSAIDTRIPSLTRQISPMQEDDDAKQVRRHRKEDYRKHRGDEQSGQRARASTSPKGGALVLTALDAHRRDVFATTPFNLDSRSLETLDEHLQTLYTEELVLQIAGGNQHPVLTSIFPAALQDPCLFTCFLAATQSFYEYRRCTGRFRPSDYLLRLQAKALAGIRDRIMQAGDGQDDNLIAGIVQLMVTDSMCGNISSLISHQRGARKLIALRKDEGENGPFFRTMLAVLVVIEFYLALVQFLSPEPATPPTGDNPLKYLKHPFPSSVCVSVSVLPSGLEDLVLTGRLSLQTISVLQKVNSWSAAVQDISSGSSDAQAAYGRLFAEPMECSRMAIFILRYLRQANRQLTIEYILLVGIVIIVKHKGSTNIADPLDDELLKVFTQTIKQFAHPTTIESETIIWIATALACRKHPVFQVHSENIIDHLISMQDRPEDLHRVQRIWSRFLWNDRFGGPWTRLWQAGLDRLRQGGASSSPSTLVHHNQGAVTRGVHSCALQDMMVPIKKEISVESSQSLPSTLSLSRSWTRSEDDARSQSLEDE